MRISGTPAYTRINVDMLHELHNSTQNYGGYEHFETTPEFIDNGQQYTHASCIGRVRISHCSTTYILNVV